MHLKLPLVVGVVALAAGAAFVRLHDPRGQASPTLVIGDSTPPNVTLAGSLAPSGVASGSPSARARRLRYSSLVKIVVYVAGEVARPGLYTLPRTSRAADAVHAAGGALPEADLVTINLAAPIADGEEVAVLAKGAAPPGTRRRRAHQAPSSAEQPASPTHHRSKKRGHRKRRRNAEPGLVADPATDAPIDIVDINSADESELETLPGIGAALAERIVTVREASGPFASPDDLLDVGGMTQGRLDALLPYVVAR